jgi:hypothetical protein
MAVTLIIRMNRGDKALITTTIETITREITSIREVGGITIIRVMVGIITIGVDIKEVMIIEEATIIEADMIIEVVGTRITTTVEMVVMTSKIIEDMRLHLKTTR